MIGASQDASEFSALYLRCRVITGKKKGEMGIRGSQLRIRLQAGARCISVPGGHVLIGATGFFVREIRLPVGAAVVVQFCRGRDEISMRGIVSNSYADLGVSVEFKEKSELAVQKLAALLAA